MATSVHHHIPSINHTINQHRAWYFVLGLILMLTSIYGIYASVSFTYISVPFYGSLLMLGAIVMLTHAISFWKNWREFYLPSLLPILYAVMGLCLMNGYALESVPLILMLGLFYLLIGALRIVMAYYQQIPAWSWMLLNGFVGISLSLFILLFWNNMQVWEVGLIISTETLFAALWSIMVSALSSEDDVEHID